MNWMMQCFWIIDLFVWAGAEKVILLNTSLNGWGKWKKNTKKFEGWRIQNLPPNGDEVYGVCDVHQLSSNSWLRSPFISRDKGISLHIKVSFTMRECKNYPDPKSLKHCEETFTLLKYESDQPTDSLQYTKRFFEPVGTISSNRKWENKDRTENILNIHESSMSVRRTGVIIAFQNTGSCVMIKEVVVFYLSCPDMVNNFVHFPKTAAGSENSIRNIEGSCVEGGVKLKQSDEQIINFCQADGSWKEISIKQFCECGPGMEGNKDKTQCLKCNQNYFKSLAGPFQCEACAKYSYSPIGSVICYCNNGYYEIPNENHQLICKRPPDKPRNLNVDISDQARIVMSWDSPPTLDTSMGFNENNSYYSIECVNCPNRLIFIPSAKTYGNRVTILGSLPSREYNFKVSTVNEVSQYVTNPFDMDQSSTKISTLTNPLENMEKIKIVSMEKDMEDIVVKWSTSASSKDILEYEAILYGFKSFSNNNFEPNNADFMRHSFTTNTSFTFVDLDLDLIYFICQVRSRNSRGWAQFSDTKSLIRKEIGRKIETFSKINLPNIMTRLVTTTIINTNIITVNPKKDVLMMIIGSVLLVVVFLIIIVLVTFCIRRQMVFNMYRQKFINEKFEPINPTQMIYSSAYSIPNQTYNKYQNPSTYEDISLALHDFTKEIDPLWLNTSTIIGKGEFGNVFQGILCKPDEDQRLVAVKILKDGASEKEKKDFLIEASTMGQFVNDNVLRLEGVITGSDPCMIITEYMVNGSLLIYLRTKKNELSTITLLKMLNNVANGMKYLSTIGFVHRDLAARNILVNENLVCKVADFGLSRELSSKDVEEIYTSKPDGKLPIKWTAPEAILYGKFTHATDVWSFGVLSWEVLSYGEKPYWQWSNTEVIDAIQSGYRLPPPVNCPPIMHNLMLHCWNLNPEKRPTFSHLYYEIEQISSQLCLNINKCDIEKRDIKNCETAHLLMHCNDLSKDPIYDISAPQPPPRNLIQDLRGTKIAMSPELNSLYSMYPRKSFGCLNKPSSNDLTNNSLILDDGSQTISLTRMNHQTLFNRPYQYFQNKTIYQPCASQVNKDHHSYAPDFFSSMFPDIPPHKTSIYQTKASRMSTKEFLTNLHLSNFIPNFLKNGIYNTDQMSHIKPEKLKMIGIISLNDQKRIIRALQPPMYC